MKTISLLALITVMTAAPVLASAPKTVFIPEASGRWSGVWRKPSWYPQSYSRKPGEATYVRNTRRGGNIATVEILERRNSYKQPGDFEYYLGIDKFDCANDTNGSKIEVLLTLAKDMPMSEVTGWGTMRQSPGLKPIAINGIKYWWNPRPYWDNEELKMSSPRIGTYGANVQDAVCANVR